MTGHDDTSSGSVTQGGSPDAGSAGPARRSGNSFVWFAVALLIGAVILVSWLTGRSRETAPAERGTTPMSGELTGGAATGAASSPAGTPAQTAPAR